MTQSPATHRTIPFNALEPATRRRLVESIAGSGAPAPLLASGSARISAVVGWALLSLLGVAAALGLAAHDFGQVHRFTQPLWLMAAYAALAVLAAWGALRAIRVLVLARRLPFARGNYVFPTDVVLATSSKLTIVSLGSLAKLDAVHRYVNGVYQQTELTMRFEGHRSVVFSVRGRDKAEQVLLDLRVARMRVAEAVERRDLEALRALDVFFEARGTEAWRAGAVAAREAKAASGAPLARPVPPLIEHALAVSLAAVVLAPPAWLARNLASDQAAYATATARGSVADLEAYAENGGWRAAQVIAHDLPEAAFREARQSGTVSSLRRFVSRYPDNPHVGEARAAIHERFVQVRRDFLASAASGDPRMPRFMGHLLDWLEAHDSPPIEVRFFAPSADALRAIDLNLGRLAQEEGVRGGIAPVSVHFTPERSAQRETSITRGLQRGFAAVFPEDVMALRHAVRTAEAEATARLDRPTFDVRYVLQPSGAVYTSDRSPRGFVGIHVDFAIVMRVPGSAAPWSIEVPVEPPEHFTVHRFGAAPGTHPHQDGLVYSVMADRAFANLGNELALRFFRPGTPAHREALAGAERDREGERSLLPHLPPLPGPMPTPVAYPSGGAPPGG
ncbi:MAG: hypothetical protein ACFCGT_22220 [Sandaracinaceae bacterium]